MEALGADRARIAAAIGPAIARKSYEVDDAFLRRFAEADPENERFFTPGREGHHQFDLEAYVLARLAEAGVTRAEALGLDTYSDPERFFSYRRATHSGEPTYGRQLSLIALAGLASTAAPGSARERAGNRPHPRAARPERPVSLSHCGRLGLHAA